MPLLNTLDHRFLRNPFTKIKNSEVTTMYFNNGYEKRKFEIEQCILHKQYKSAGLSEEAIREMYVYDLAFFNLCRRETEHAIEPQQLVAGDAETGETRYMEMDELPSNNVLMPFSDGHAWTAEIENKDMAKIMYPFSEDYIEIITLLLEGYSQSDIARIQGVSRVTVCKKVNLIREKLKVFV
jgi:hypothetical protein